MAIVIIIGSKYKAKQLIADRLCFKEVVKKGEKYWDVELESVCLKCYRIGYKRLRNSRNRPKKCVMCTNI